MMVVLAVFMCVSSAARADDDFATRYKAYLEREDCLDTDILGILMRCLSPDGSVRDAYLHLNQRPDVRWKTYDPVLARHYMRRDALSKPRADLEAQLQIIRDDYAIEIPFMYEMYEEAMDWAEAEKQKDADYLYKMSKDVLSDPHIKDQHLRESIALRYRLLAEENGHPKAIAEMKDIRDKILRKWTPDYAEEHP